MIANLGGAKLRYIQHKIIGIKYGKNIYISVGKIEAIIYQQDYRRQHKPSHALKTATI